MDKKTEKSVDWSAVSWDQLVPRLLSYAVRRMRVLGWRGQKPGGYPPDLSVEDIVQAAITKTITGQRIWPKDRVPLFEYLAMVIRSDLGHLARSWENRALRSNEEVIDVFLEESPIERDEHRLVQKDLLGFLEKRDPTLAEIALLMINEGVFSAVELRHRIGCSSEDIYKLKRRFKRALVSYQKQLGVDNDDA